LLIASLIVASNLAKGERRDKAIFRFGMAEPSKMRSKGAPV